MYEQHIIVIMYAVLTQEAEEEEKAPHGEESIDCPRQLKINCAKVVNISLFIQV